MSPCVAFLQPKSSQSVPHRYAPISSSTTTCTSLHVRVPRNVPLIQWDDDNNLEMQRLNSEINQLESSKKSDASSLYSDVDQNYIDPVENPKWYEMMDQDQNINGLEDPYKDYKGQKDVQMLFKEQLQSPLKSTVEEEEKRTESELGTEEQDESSLPSDEDLERIGWAKAFDGMTDKYYFYSLDRTQTSWENPLMLQEKRKNDNAKDQKGEDDETYNIPENNQSDSFVEASKSGIDEPTSKEQVEDSPTQVNESIDKNLAVASVSQKANNSDEGDQMTFEKIHSLYPGIPIDAESEKKDDMVYNDFFLRVYDEYSNSQLENNEERESRRSGIEQDSGRNLLNKSEVQRVVEETLKQAAFNQEDKSLDDSSLQDAPRVVNGRRILAKSQIQKIVEEALQEEESGEIDEGDIFQETPNDDINIRETDRGRQSETVEIQQAQEDRTVDSLMSYEYGRENDGEIDEKISKDTVLRESAINIRASQNSGGELLPWELLKLKSYFDSLQLCIEMIVNAAKFYKWRNRDQLLFPFEVNELKSSYGAVQTGLGLAFGLFNVTIDQSLQSGKFTPSSEDIVDDNTRMDDQIKDEKPTNDDGISSEINKLDLPFFLSQIKDYDDSKEGKIVRSSFNDLKIQVNTFQKDLIRIKATDELTAFEKNYRMTKEVQDLLWEVSKLTSTSKKIQGRIEKRKKNYQSRLSLNKFISDDLEPVGDFLQRTANALKAEQLGWDVQEQDMKSEKKKVQRDIQNVEDEMKVISDGINALQTLINAKEQIIVNAREDVEVELSKWSEERDNLEAEYVQIESLLTEEEENIGNIELSLQEAKETKSEWTKYQEVMLQDRIIVYEKLIKAEEEVKNLIMNIDDVTESLVTAMRVILKKNDESIISAKKEIDLKLSNMNKRVEQLESIRKRFFQISLIDNPSRSNQLQQKITTQNNLSEKDQIINPFQRLYSIYQTSQLLPRVKRLSDEQRELDKLRERLDELMYAKDTSYNSLHMMDVAEIKNAKGMNTYVID